MSTGLLASALAAAPAAAQTVMVVGTPHLTGLEDSPNAAQLAQAVEALAAFEPTQVCVERMSGARIEVLLMEPARNAMTLTPEMAGRPLATMIVPIGIEMQAKVEKRPADARDAAARLISRWSSLDLEERVEAIRLQLAGYEFHSAVLNWSHLNDAERRGAAETLGANISERLEHASNSVHEVYSLGVALARRVGLHELCTADSLEDESRGMQIAMEHGGMEIIESPEAQASFEAHRKNISDHWSPASGDRALLALLHYTNGEEYEEMDRRLQWETLRRLDNEAGAFSRRFMYWHARTAEISAELFRALAKGPDERVLLIIGAAHRPFTEADLRAQPWVEVESAELLLQAR